MFVESVRDRISSPPNRPWYEQNDFMVMKYSIGQLMPVKTLGSLSIQDHVLTCKKVGKKK